MTTTDALASPNEYRAALGAEAILAPATLTKVAYQEPVQTAIEDVLAYIAHFCDRVGLNPQAAFMLGLERHRSNLENGPGASQPPNTTGKSLAEIVQRP